MSNSSISALADSLDKRSVRERVFLMSMAPRGIVAAAVSAIFALRLEEEEILGAEVIVPVVFLIIIGTILVYGFLAGPIARRHGLVDAQAATGEIQQRHRGVDETGHRSRVYAADLPCAGTLRSGHAIAAARARVRGRGRGCLSDRQGLQVHGQGHADADGLSVTVMV